MHQSIIDNVPVYIYDIVSQKHQTTIHFRSIRQINIFGVITSKQIIHLEAKLGSQFMHLKKS